jgi:hypothetical protein
VTLVEAQNSKYFAHSLGKKWRPCPHVQSKRCQTTMQAFLEWHRSFCMHCFDEVVASGINRQPPTDDTRDSRENLPPT